ncbi:hypothetical protein SAMN06269185_0010 [Natronoarchaeum philippinense]|uniref:Uncharacterized protein n=1 Tax=Natronoarchaeum philippinense TaxID=558529 RepID=A0A285N3S0_NATPI|nr:hypothetical protein [Natronoarchaeum philippinense]SNZ02391.1 hypothetical protein SAMN06269185_0010 [Natronoarchaeum philippinense]
MFKSREAIIITLAITSFFFIGGTTANDTLSSFQKNSNIVETEQNISNGYNVNVSVTSQHNATIHFQKVEKSLFKPEVDLKIDGYKVSRSGPTLENGGTWSTNVNLSNKYNVSKKNHSVRVSSFGVVVNTTLTKQYDLENPNIPATRIQNVEVVETKHDGEPTAAVDVVFKNPSPRVYGASIYAHTLKTNLRTGNAMVPRNQTTMVTRLHLREDPDEMVEGELRMTTTRLNKDKGLRDQVWFRGTADGDTEWQREPYEPVGYISGENPYTYSKDEGLLESYGLSTRQVLGGGVLAIIAIALVFRRRTSW